MDIHHQIRPDVVYGLEVVFFDDTLKQDLHPCRNTYDDANVPFWSGLYHEVHLLSPVFHLRNFLPRFIESLKPRRDFTC